MTTSGSSGRKGLFVYDQAGWTAIAAQFLYFSAMAGTRPRLPRLKLAAIGGGSPAHMSRRGARTLDVGLHRILSLPVTPPRGRARRGAQPLRPGRAATSTRRWPCCWPRSSSRGGCDCRCERCRRAASCARPRRPRASRRRSACGRSTSTRRPRGCGAASASATTGLHLFEDDVIVENVDDDGRRGGRRRAGRAPARDEPRQSRPAAHPPGGLRRDDAERADVRAAGARCGASSGSRDALRTSSGCRAPTGGPSPSCRCSSPSSPATATSSSSRSCRRARAWWSSWSGAARRPGSRSGCAPAWPSGCARWAWRASRSTCGAAMPSSARPAASCRSSSPIVRRSTTA